MVRFKDLQHCRNVLKFAIAYLKESGYPKQSSAVSRAVTEIEQDLRSKEVQEWIKEKND